MLPEKLSNDLCSLRPHEDRPTMVAHMWIDQDGKLHKHKFTRAVIHSHARLTYNQVQEALNGDIPEIVKPVMESTITPLYMAYKVLLKIRAKRGALDLDVPETVIMMNDAGDITTLEKRSRFESHQLIEEMMVLANVAAASQLQTKGAPCLYRIHPEPSELKMDALKMALKDFGLSLSGTFSPLAIQNTLNNARDEHKDALYMTVLRSLEQARYDPENVGHFGLALERYAHFTSPIRRYSDLVVHRSLIKNLNLTGSKDIQQPANLIKVADHLCITERRAQKAEWEVKDRLTVRFYQEFVGNKFKARITTLTKFGMFLAVDDGAAEGMMPYRFMSDDHYFYNEQKNSLTGKRSKKVIKVGHHMMVKLIEADPITGRMTFAPENASADDIKANQRGARGKLYGKKRNEKQNEGGFKKGNRPPIRSKGKFNKDKPKKG
jgi:ribonuclease R